MNADTLIGDSRIDIAEMRENATQAAELLKAMSNENRLLILCHLGEKEMSVSELNGFIDLSQSSLSQHLARLRKDGLVKTRRQSQTIYYTIANNSVVKLIALLQREFCP
ncbi:MAG: winged helix-turn-helix transcriptional regulator [Colwellia sp.]|nr:winged helix-turn-helix transcriptional regulator [Colwellia sp.]